MNVRILETGINHNGNELRRYKVYDLPEKVATRFVELAVATTDDIDGEDVLPEPEVAANKKEKPTAYVAEAKVDTAQLTEEELEQKAKIDAEAKPVIPPTPEKDPESVTKVFNDKGEEITDPKELEKLDNVGSDDPNTPPNDSVLSKE